MPLYTHRTKHRISAKGATVNVVIWLPAMFLLGIAGMRLCIALLEVCEKI